MLRTVVLLFLFIQFSFANESCLKYGVIPYSNVKDIKKNYVQWQEYLSSKIIEKQGELKFWPDNWFCSFRFHCLHKIGPFRHFFEPRIPTDRKNLKVIVFHGDPNPKEASQGIWELKKGQEWKRLYKVCKPTSWVNKYWHNNE